MNPVDLGARGLAIILVAGGVFGAAGVLFLKRRPNSARIRTAVNRVIAHLLEFRLFADEPAVLLKAQWHLLAANGRLLRMLLLPSLWLGLAFLPVFIYLDGLMGHAPLVVGEAAVVTVQVRPGLAGKLEQIRLVAPPGVAIDTPAVRIPADSQVSWRVRARQPLSGKLEVRFNGGMLAKTVVAGTFLSTPGLEMPFSSSMIEWIRIDYPTARVYGVYWLVWFSIGSLLGGVLVLLAGRRLALGILAVMAFTVSCGWRGPPHYPNVIVLGVDGMDPAFVERHWDALPHLAALRQAGSFSRLGTTTPPQSPVAWSTFITGLSPADHEIFDFVHRDPKTLEPFSSMSKTTPAKGFALGPYLVPWSSGKVTSLRRGTPFWERLSAKGIPVDVVRMPTNYPPDGHERALSGMGTPDLTGTLGTFTFFTDDPAESSRTVPGGRVVQVTFEEQRVRLLLDGPANPLRRDKRVTQATITVDVDPENAVARFQIGKQQAILRQGEWSEWMPVEFPLIPHLASTQGMVRIFAKQLHPGLELYVSPINLDPMNPALPISVPSGWARTVAQEIGRYSTLGIPEDTSGLRQNALTLKEFQSQTKLVFDEEHRLLQYSLRHFQGGLLFFYFSSVDQNSHMLWGKHESELLKVYEEVDGAIGEVRTAAPGAELIVMSDHGFSSYDRSVHLNTWLQHHGFLQVHAGSGSDSGLSAINWPSTRAYALGLNGLYLNLQGREAHGVVTAAQRETLLNNLREQLLAWRDPVSGRQVIEAVQEIRVTPQNAGVAPDLIVGYARGYRASWQTGLGGLGPDELEDNTDSWIGDHCINAADVPGVLFTSRRIVANSPRLEDVTASLLGLFGVSPSAESTGVSLYSR